MKISIVIPVFNSELTLEALVLDIRKELKDFSLEIILVNDCSIDSSREVCAKLSEAHSFISYITLRKNKGEHNAVICGLNFATGDYVVIMDDDFQNPPSEIIKLINTAENGDYDVVYSHYAKKEHSLWRNIASSFHDSVVTILLKKPKSLYLSSFKILNKELYNEVVKYKGPFPYLDGLILSVTSLIGTVLVEHKPRLVGKSNYNLEKLIRLYLNMMLNFSLKPIRFFTVIGIFTFLIGMVLMAFSLSDFLFAPNIFDSNVLLRRSTITLAGFNLMFCGLIGEYIGKLFRSFNGKTQYSIKTKNIKDFN